MCVEGSFVVVVEMSEYPKSCHVLLLPLRQVGNYSYLNFCDLGIVSQMLTSTAGKKDMARAVAEARARVHVSVCTTQSQRRPVPLLPTPENQGLLMEGADDKASCCLSPESGQQRHLGNVKSFISGTIGNGIMDHYPACTN